MYEIPRWSKKPEQCKRILQTFSNINELSKEQIKCVVKSLQNRIYHIKGYSVFVLIIFKGLLHKLASDGKACRTDQPHKWLLFDSSPVITLLCQKISIELSWLWSGCWRNRLCNVWVWFGHQFSVLWFTTAFLCIYKTTSDEPSLNLVWT